MLSSTSQSSNGSIGTFDMSKSLPPRPSISNRNPLMQRCIEHCFDMTIASTVCDNAKLMQLLQRVLFLGGVWNTLGDTHDGSQFEKFERMLNSTASEVAHDATQSQISSCHLYSLDTLIEKTFPHMRAERDTSSPSSSQQHASEPIQSMAHADLEFSSSDHTDSDSLRQSETSDDARDALMETRESESMTDCDFSNEDESPCDDPEWCFLCHIKQREQSLQNSREFSQLIKFIEDNKSKISPRALVHRVQYRYNTDLRRHVIDRKFWTRRTIWAHIEQQHAPSNTSILPPLASPEATLSPGQNSRKRKHSAGELRVAKRTCQASCAQQSKCLRKLLVSNALDFVKSREVLCRDTGSSVCSMQVAIADAASEHNLRLQSLEGQRKCYEQIQRSLIALSNMNLELHRQLGLIFTQAKLQYHENKHAKLSDNARSWSKYLESNFKGSSKSHADKCIAFATLCGEHPSAVCINLTWSDVRINPTKLSKALNEFQSTHPAQYQAIWSNTCVKQFAESAARISLIEE